MVGQIILILVVFVIAILLGRIVIPGILMVAFDKNLFDLPDERKVHMTKEEREDIVKKDER